MSQSSVTSAVRLRGVGASSTKLLLKASGFGSDGLARTLRPPAKDGREFGRQQGDDVAGPLLSVSTSPLVRPRVGWGTRSATFLLRGGVHASFVGRRRDISLVH